MQQRPFLYGQYPVNTLIVRYEKARHIWRANTWMRPHIPRVLSCVSTRMAIHLDLTLPPSSSSLPEDWASNP